MVQEEIDLTLSDDEHGNVPQPPHPVTPVRCKSESGPAVASAGGIGSGNDEDEGLKAATTGGKGLWSLWTRNFKSPLLMLLDLVDNAVDAAMQHHENDFTGRVQIYRDLYEIMPEQTYTTGLCIRNNSPQKIAPLKEVLQLFISAKSNSGSDSIGENGVGLKQSCAALSDLSFVLVKNGEHKFELGILAKALQREDMVVLPYFEFMKGNVGRTIGQQMLEIFTKPQYKEVAECVAEYGQIRSGGSPSLARGVARLSKHFDDIDSNFFDNPYVFEVIIDKHGDPQSAGTRGKHAAVRDIINELQHEIPRRYLHIPDDSFKFRVGKKELTFKYWPERLVEFTKVEIPCRSETRWDEDFGEISPDSYFLGVYIGFDRFRITDPENGIRKQKKTCSLYIYSRASGRMIQLDPDARNLLGLTSGGTDFCQALTVIIDDIEGHLPLDPTKQGIAFGNQVNGNVHKENLFAVVGCVVKFYYNYHKNKFGGKKTILSQKIAEFGDSELPENVHVKTCGSSQLTNYGVKFIMTKDNRIQVGRLGDSVEEIIGPDTIFRLLPETYKGSKGPNDKVSEEMMPPAKKRPRAVRAAKQRPPATKKQRAAKTRKSPAKKKQPVANVRKSPTKRKPPAPKAVKPTPKKKPRSAKATAVPPKAKGTRSSHRRTVKPKRFGAFSYAESDEDEEEDDTDDRESVDELTEDPIDLCSSSDEENEVTNEDVPAQAYSLPAIKTEMSDVAGNVADDEEVDDDASSLDEENAPLKSPARPTLPEGETEYTTDCPSIGEGWTQQIVARSGGGRGGRQASDRYYFSPGGKRFRSMAEVNRHLIDNDNEGADNGGAKSSPKKANHNSPTAASRGRPRFPVKSTTTNGKEANGKKTTSVAGNVAADEEVADGAPGVADDASSLDEENEVVNKDVPAQAGNSKATNIETNDVAEKVVKEVDKEKAADAKTLQIEITKLKRENTNLKARVTALQSENYSLEAEVINLRDELEQSQRTIAVIKRRSNDDIQESGEDV